MFKENIFENKIIAITGGGSGIGLEIAKHFLQYGAKVYIASRKIERLEKAQATLKEFGNCFIFPLDIREIEQVQAFADFIKTESGQLDILINNAGGQFPSPAEEISKNGWAAVVNTNLNGTWYVTQTMAKNFFINQEEGTIINIIANVKRGFPGMVHTGAARAGVENMTKTLAVEWAAKNIRINAVAPGVIFSDGLKNYPPALLTGISDKIPMKRLGSVSDVANLVTFLSSNMAAYITGETVYVDGGSKLWGDFYEF